MKSLNLKAERARRELKQSDMAKLLGISTNSYSSKENGEIQFKKDEIDLILEKFGAKYEDIFKEG